MSGAPPVPPDADGLGQHVAVAVRGEVPCGDLPLVGHLLRQGMIAGQLLELAPAEQVGLAALYRVSGFSVRKCLLQSRLRREFRIH